METKRPIRVLIVGAGLGGMAAAYCFAHHGHHVELFERKSSLSPRGGTIMIRPNASRILSGWGLQAAFNAVSDVSSATVYRSGSTGEVLQRRLAALYSEYSDWGTDRESALILLDKEARKAGARVSFGVTVTEISDSATGAVATLSTDERVDADLVLVADGINSRLRSHVVDPLSEPSGPLIGTSTLYQVTISGPDIRSDSCTRQLCETTELNVWMGDGGYVVGRYNTRLDRFNAIFGTLGDAKENLSLWEATGDLTHVREHFEQYHDIIVTLLRMAKSCDRWRMAQMPDLQNWTSKHGRLLLLGDSAHAMYPDAAQGFSQIVEDIAALHVLLTSDKVDNESIASATSAWQELRKPRVERIKSFARSNHDLYAQGGAQFPKQPDLSDESSVKGRHDPASSKTGSCVRPDMWAAFNTPAFNKWVHGYDVQAEARVSMESRCAVGECAAARCMQVSARS